jgi:6-phosphogluconolactonase
MPLSQNILIFDDENQMSEFMVEKWEEISERALKKKGYFAAGLSGGKTPFHFYRRLAESSGRPFWDGAHIFFVDERFLSFDHRDSNYRTLRETLLQKIPIPEENIHPIPTGEASLQIAARGYEEELMRFFKVLIGQYPEFDLILLGIGEDGHTASLFPGSDALSERIHLTAAVMLDEVRHHRITLTLPVINQSVHVIFIVKGKNKAPILKKIIGREDPLLPASMVQPKSENLLFLVDREASSLLSL